MQSYKMTCSLSQQTPMIHFQADQKGVCLRPSDVKPRLDKFLHKYYKEKLSSKWLVKPDADSEKVIALNYKMQISAPERKPFITERIHKLYFGNMRGSKSNKSTIFYNDEITLDIICFIPDLMELIKNTIADFFFINNFGTRQNKGFGSFCVTSINGNKCSCDILECVSKYYKKFFYMEYGAPARKSFDDPVETSSGIVKERCYTKMLNNIHTYYSWLKSGQNFRGEYHRAYVYRYAYSKHIGNEKKWMKDNNISPKIATSNKKFWGNTNEYTNKFKYVRAMLGIPEKLEYSNSTMINKLGRKVIDSGNKVTVKVSDTEKNKDRQIQRCPSPITFKVADKYVLILFEEMPAIMSGHKFNFKGLTSGTLAVPEPSDNLSVEELLTQYRVHLNSIKRSPITPANNGRSYQTDKYKERYYERYYKYPLPEIQIKERG